MKPPPQETPAEAVRRDISHLTTAYAPDGRHGPTYPALMDTLAAGPPTLARDAGDGRRPAPGSRPPATLDYLALTVRIQGEALTWYARVFPTPTGSPSWALMALAGYGHTPGLARDTARWVHAAEILLGYRDPIDLTAQRLRRPCFDCGATEVHTDPHSAGAQCWACGADYPTQRLRLLAMATGL